MKKGTAILLITMLITSFALGQSSPEKDSLISNPNYHKELVDKLGADDYGIKSYFLVILETGTNTATD